LNNVGLAGLQKLRNLPGRSVLIGLLALIAIIASRGKWLIFPMTDSVSAPELGGTEMAVLVLGGLAVWRLSSGASLLLISAALTCVVSLPLNVAWQHPEWLERYLVEAGDRRQLARFLNQQEVVNLSPDPSLLPIESISDIGDQLIVALATMGKAWYVALFSLVSLIVISLWRDLPRRFTLWGLLTTFALGPILLLPLTGMARGQWLLESALGDMAAGQAKGALVKLEALPETNPGALASHPYWLQVELAASQADGGGGDAPVWASAIAFQLQLTRSDGQKQAISALLNEIYPKLLQTQPASPWESRRRAIRQTVVQELRLHQAWQLREDDDPVGALAALDQAAPEPTRAAWLLWAYLRLQQGGWTNASTLLGELDRSLVQPLVRADIACTLGDALTGAGRLLDARKAYLVCRDLDEVTNFRVMKALGGT
jgi:hypothetical protein